MIKIIVPVYYTIEKKRKKNENKLVAMNWYRNAHFVAQNNIKHHYKRIIFEQLNKIAKEKFNKVKIGYTIYLKRKGTDGGNVRSVIEKFVLDALVEYGLLIDDTIDYVIGDQSNYYYDKENPRCEIEIFSVDN
jgi:hypothetical protein